MLAELVPFLGKTALAEITLICNYLYKIDFYIPLLKADKMKLFFDIETLPAGKESEQAVKHLYQKYRQKGSGTLKNYNEFLRATSFDGTFGRIFCIGYAINNSVPQVLYSAREKEILIQFWQLAQNAKLFIGHNIIDFDLPFIFQRSVIHKVKPSRALVGNNCEKDAVFDTYKQWTSGSSCAKGGLGRLALAFNEPSSKTELDGSKVYNYYLNKKYKEIIDYCKKDVVLTRKIYERITFAY